jgi:Ca2+-binding RTX toxin-like protein
MAIITATKVGDTITGTAEDDSITGSSGGDLIRGAGGADTIDGASAIDTIYGGLGNDSITASTYGLTFGDEGNDTIFGLPDETASFIEGGAGDDLMDGHYNDPQVFISYAMYTTATSGVTVNIDRVLPQVVGGGHGVDTLRNFNGVVGSAYNDTLSGDGVLVGGAGDDQLLASPLGSTLDGGAGNDVLTGGADADTVVFGFAPRAGIYENPAATGALTIDLRLATPQAIGGGMGVDTFISIENIVGGAFSDSLTGSDAANMIMGEQGNDYILGLGGDDNLTSDTFEKAASNDTVFGGAGNDRILDMVGGSNRLWGDEGDDRVTGGADFDNIHGNMGVDTLEGGAGGDVVRGGQGDDIVRGEAGDDWLSGDRGSDTLTGGTGADTFHTWVDAGVDRVTDFNAGDGDRVNLLAGSTYTLAQVGADTVVQVTGGAQMTLVGAQQSSLPAGWIFVA